MLALAVLHDPRLPWAAPFALLLLAIAVFPLLPRVHHWWEHNRNRLLVAGGLGCTTLLYYYFRPDGFGAGSHAAAPGAASVAQVLYHAIVEEYVPFITLLFSLFVISGGVFVRGDIPATPRTNTIILGLGGLLASLIGTTGASMLLIRFLLRTNSERRRTVHTFVFFIFIVSNVGGCLLPIGDPPLFLGYLRGVPFFWTLNLWKEWLLLMAALLAIYYLWDARAFRLETPQARALDRARIEPIRVTGQINLLWLALVVVAVATLDPNKDFPGTSWRAWPWVRELVQLALVGLSLLTTPRGLRQAHEFNYAPIIEVACLFLGIFVTMQTPIEILHTYGAKLSEAGIDRPWQYFWATGALSSVLDNAPTYVVFFETANQLTHQPGPGIIQLLSGEYLRVDLLAAISCGAVFMGALTYIGNGPNFMVKTICEQNGVRMPTFFHYMGYSCAVLLPLFAIMTFALFAH